MQEGPRRSAARLAGLVLAGACALVACGQESPESPPDGPASPRAAVTGEPPPPAAGTALSMYDFAADPGAGVQLPAGLEEVSGLAVDEEGRLYAHGDETAVVQIVNPATGGLAARFGAGRPVLRSDFEGLAWAAGRLWLVDSDGNLVSMPRGGPEEVVAHQVVRTGLGTACEVEGTGSDRVWGKLILACKDPRTDEGRDRLRLYHASTGDGALDGHPVVDMPLEELALLDLPAELHPSAVELHPDTDSYLVLAARERLIVEVNRAGHPVAAVRLPANRMPQAEGLAVAPEGTLYIATEGAGGPGRLFRWERRPTPGDPPP